LKHLFQIILLFLFLIFANKLFAESTPLAWDANPPEDMVDYYTIYTTYDSGEYLVVDAILDVDALPEPTAVVETDLYPNECVYFVVTASNSTNESGFSNEVYKCLCEDGLIVINMQCPAPEPTPIPLPEPQPIPDPVPEPQPVPNPTLEPQPATSPEPVLPPVPQPTPNPKPVPEPAPEPVINPVIEQPEENPPIDNQPVKKKKKKSGGSRSCFIISTRG